MHAIQNSSGRKCEAMSLGKTVRDLNNARQTGKDGGVWEEERGTEDERREGGIAEIISISSKDERESPAVGASDDVTTRQTRPASAQPGRTLRRLRPPRPRAKQRKQRELTRTT